MTYDDKQMWFCIEKSPNVIVRHEMSPRYMERFLMVFTLTCTMSAHVLIDIVF